MAKQLRVTLIRSGINRVEKQKRTIRGLAQGDADVFTAGDFLLVGKA